MTDIQARLRDWKYGDNGTHKIAHALRMEAVDEIARLTKEVERLKADRDEWKETAEETRDIYQEEIGELKTLYARIAKALSSTSPAKRRS